MSHIHREIRPGFCRETNKLVEHVDMFGHGWNREDFMAYLQHTLIPDLFDSGMSATAEDFQTALVFIANPPQPKKTVRPEYRPSTYLNWAALMKTIIDGRVCILSQRLIKQRESGFHVFVGPKSKLP